MEKFDEDKLSGVEVNGVQSEGKNQILKGKTILLINTGSPKKRFILQKLKKLGLKIIVLNKEKNWALPYADEWIITDTINHKESIQAVERFLADNPKLKLDGALTFWEDDVLLTAKITDRFNLIGIPFQIAKKTRNKYLFRNFCAKNNLPFPKHKLVNSTRDLNYVANNFTFPLVIKPAYGSSSAFVVRVNSPKELKDIYNYIKTNISPNTESSLTDGLEIFVEEYIEGDEVDIDLLLQNGKIKFFSISDNFDKSKDIFFLDNGQSIPSSLPLQKQQELYDLAEETLERLGIQNGCLHFEAKSTKTGAVPIEVNLRMGGDYIYSYIKEAWGVDLIETAVKIATSQYFKITKPEVPRKYIIGWDLHPDNSGILVELNIDEEIKKRNYLEEIHIYKQIGDAILVPPEGYEYLGWITVSGSNFLDAQDNLKDALRFINYRVVKYNLDSALGKTQRRNRFSSAVLNKNLLLSVAKIETTKRKFKENQKNLQIGVLFNSAQDDSDPIAKEIDKTAHLIQKSLLDCGYTTSLFDANNYPQIIENLKKSEVDLVFNLGERLSQSNLFKPHLAALLETLQIPFVGSDYFCLAFALDKIKAKKMLTFHEIPTPKWDYAYEVEDKIDQDLSFPLIVKPANTDYSVGINNESVVSNKKELQKQLEKVIKETGRPALVEEYIEGDEYDVSILGNNENDLQVLPLSRSIFKNMPKNYWHIYAYEAKWSDTPAYDKIIVQRPPKNISKKLESLITEIALDTYQIFNCHEYGRVEIRVDKDNNPYVLELNPNPPLSPDTCIPNVARLIGYDYTDLLEEIINLAIHRYQNNTGQIPKPILEKINGYL